VKPRTALLAVVLLAGIGGGPYSLLSKENTPITGNGSNSTAVIPDSKVTVHTPNAPLKLLANTLLVHNVPHEQWDVRLREIANSHKKLLARLATMQSADPKVRQLKAEAWQAIKAGKYAKVEELLHQAEALDLAAIKELEQAAQQQRLSAAATNAVQAMVQEVQFRYAKAAEYWQKAAALLPEGEKKNKAYYLNAAGEDLYHISRYSEASSLFEQSLAISREIGNREGEGESLGNIAGIHYAWDKYDKALPLLEQSLAISREIGNRKGEGESLNNIGMIYDAQGKYDKALPLLEQSLAICREIGEREGEGIILNNIGMIYDAQGKYAKALPLLEQSLAIFREIGNRDREVTLLNIIAWIHQARDEYDKALSLYKQSLAISQEIDNRQQEVEISWTIGRIYKLQGDLTKAEQYIARLVQLAEEIGHPLLEVWRKDLEKLRAEIKEQ
jgi:tetratricopeptide (TPR) repeat protein